MKISIFGLGYVGCVSSGCLAKNGHHIIGVELNSIKIDFMNKGRATIVEKDIDYIISKYHKLGLISATKDGVNAVQQTDVSFICVGTPSTPDGHLELKAVFKVAEEIGRGLRKKESFHVIVIRSTVLPGANYKVSKIIEDISGKDCDVSFAVVSNPEFLREGSAVEDFYNPPYTLVGSSNVKAIEIMKHIYDGINAPVIVTDVKIAEIIKYVSNTFHALKVTFANEIGNICKKIGVDSHLLMDIFCKDKQLNISPYYLKPGFAYGGSCLPKDLRALRTIAHDFYLECPIIENIGRSNDFQIKYVFNKIVEFNKQNIGFLGLSFKAGTDDLRNSPIIDIIEQLLGKGYGVKIFDKNVRISQLMGANQEYVLKKIPFISQFIVDDSAEVVEHSDLIVIVNKEKEFEEILKHLPKEKMIYDLVNIQFDEKSDNKNYIGIAW